MVPMEILRQGSRKVVLFLLDLFVSPNADALYRTKLMVVGFESVGKTTVLDCLFPLTGTLATREGFFNVRKEYFFSLQGRLLRKYETPEAFAAAQDPLEELVLENREWTLEEPAEDKKGAFSVIITPTSAKKSSAKALELTADTKEKRAQWAERLRRVLFNAATHGIEIQHLELRPNRALPVTLPAMASGLAPPAALDLTVWDFAGQHDYYNNHHYFLSTRTVFLVLWKMSEGDKGLKGLEFWFRSLVVHVSSPATAAAASSSSSSKGRSFSVLVVGTFLDHPNVARGERAKRERVVRTLAADCGLESAEMRYHEVSSWTLENIPDVQNSIFTSALTHSYMGERVPKSYVIVERAIQELRGGRADLPIVDTALVLEKCRSYLFLDANVMQRALNLLTLWGECVYFDHPEELASTVVLEPRFLTKEVLGQLFNPRLVFFYKNGIIKHANLVHIWSAFKDRRDFTQIAVKLMALMQRFEVCFQLDDAAAVAADGDDPISASASADLLVSPSSSSLGSLPAPDISEPALLVPAATREKKDLAAFFEQSSIIPSLLPVKPASAAEAALLSQEERDKLVQFATLWPADLPHNQRVQVERVLRFNVVPAELVARLLVRLHPYIQRQMIWRHDVLLLKDKTQAWVQVTPASNRFVVTLRGSHRERCCALMDYIVGEVETVAANYSGVEWTQAIRSPNHSGTLIDLAEALADLTRDPEHRALVCPETRLPIKAEVLLAAAGLLDETRDAKASSSWWDFEFARAKGDRRDNLERWPVVEDGEIRDAELFAKLSTLFDFFQVDPNRITKAFALDNRNLRSAFEAARQSISQRHKDSPSLFRREDWREEEDADLRRTFLWHLADGVTRFRMPSFNDGARLPVVPAIQGTTEDAAWKVAENGFGTVATRDQGYFGKGMYFTSDFDYAANYARATPEGDALFMVSLVIPGNSYPVTEAPFLPNAPSKDQRVENPRGFYGKTCQSGYQSHYTLSKGGFFFFFRFCCLCCSSFTSFCLCVS